MNFSQVRLIVVPKLEMWIMNPKVSRAAQELLMAVAMNCTTHTNDEVEVITNNEVITNFLKLRFKNKPNINLYLACIKELANANREVNLPTLIKLTIFNELSNARNPNNMQMLNVMFGCGQLPPANSSQGPTSNDLAAASLAAVFVDLLLQKECYLRALRALLREIVRALQSECQKRKVIANQGVVSNYVSQCSFCIFTDSGPPDMFLKAELL